MLPMAPEPVEAPRAPPADGAQRFRVDGMDCAACARTVEKAVAALDGVQRRAMCRSGPRRCSSSATSTPTA